MSRYVNARPVVTDINGDPIVGAKKFFFEISGGNIPKTIYKDRELLIPHTNPVISDPNGRYVGIFLDGLYLEEQQDNSGTATGYDGVTLWTEEVGNLPQATEWGLYNVSKEYSATSIVTYNNKYYKSRINNNIGNTPSVSSVAWSEVNISEFWNFSKAYDKGDTVIGSDGFNYISTTDNNSANDPISSLNWITNTRKMRTAIDTDSSEDRMRVVFSPPYTVLKDGDEIIVRSLARNTGNAPMVISIDSVPDKNIMKNGNNSLYGGDIYGAGHELILKYNIANDVFELLNPSVDSAGRVVQKFIGKLSSRISGSNPFVATASIPSFTDGDEFMFITYTPQYDDSELHIEFKGDFVISGAGGVVSAAIFVDSIVNAIGASSVGYGDTIRFFQVGVEAVQIVNNNLNPIRIAVRVGDPTASTLIMNGDSATTSLYGGKQVATLTVTEVRPNG